MSYAECLKKYDNAVDGTFYDAIKIDDPNSVRWCNMANGKLNCWEYKKCAREKIDQNSGELSICPAASDASFDSSCKKIY